MPLLGRVIRSFLSKKWIFSPQHARNELANFSSKVEVPVPPKRPLTAYMIFCKENRKELRKENPDLSNPEQIRKLAEKWSQLNEESRKPFEIMAREKTLIYGEEHKKFFENLSDEQKVELAKHKAEKKMARQLLKLKKTLRESGLPKRPAASAYAFFVKSFAKDNKNIKKAVEFIKEAAAQWKALPEEKKKFYEEQAQEQKRNYLHDLDLWKNKLIKDGKLDLLNEYNRMKGHNETGEDISTRELKVKNRIKTKSM